MTLRGARILSSANDASVKNEQNTNINIKFKQQPPNNTSIGYPTIPTVSPYAQTQIPQTQNVNFTQEASVYPSVPEIPAQEVINKEIPLSTNFESIIEQKHKENTFLKMLLQIYQEQPLIINSYVICKSTVLMDII